MATNKPHQPDGWVERFLGRADLERSFQELEPYQHFHTSTLRGRIRSLQLRFGEAWDHFEEAYRLSHQAEQTIPNLAKLFLLEINRFDLALIQGPSDLSLELPRFDAPNLSRELRNKYPEIPRLIALRKQYEGFFRVYKGDYSSALQVLRETVTENPTATRLIVPCYIGLAACYDYLGRDVELKESIECAELATQATEWTVNRCHYSSLLVAVHSFLGNGDSRRDWNVFLSRLECPQATKDIFAQRAELVLQRCTTFGRIVLI